MKEYLAKRKEQIENELKKKQNLIESYQKIQQNIKQEQDQLVAIAAVHDSINAEELNAELAQINSLLEQQEEK